MKKLWIVITAILICLCLSACSKSAGETENRTTAAPQTTQSKTTATERMTSTTASPKTDEEKSGRLAAAVKDHFEEAGSVVTDSRGGFEFKLADLDEGQMYSMEMSEKMQKNAENNAKALVGEIQEYYPYALTYESTDAQQIGTGDNGIDSAVYVILYTNTQNQKLELRADSTGSIYYIDCDFTW